MKVKTDLAHSGLQHGFFRAPAQEQSGSKAAPAAGPRRLGFWETARVVRDVLLILMLAVSIGSVGLGHYLAGLVGAMLCIVACAASQVPAPNPYEKKPYDPEDPNEGF